MTERINILTTGRLGEDFQAAVKKEYNPEEIKIDYFAEIDQKILDRYDALACFSAGKDLDLGRLDWIHSFGAGVNSFIENPSLNPQVKISRTIGLLGKKMAEYCLCYILAPCKNCISNYENQKNRIWQQGKITDLFSSSVAILGTGEIGSTVAEMISAFHCDVYGINLHGKQYPQFKKCFKLEDFVKSPPSINVLISILPSTESTRNLLTKEFFQKLSKLHFINVGRGDVIAEKLLLELLEGSIICQATLDVFSAEPLPENSALWNNPKVVITPHQAAITDIDDIMMSFTQAYEAFKKGENNYLFIKLNRGY
jgi:glyoxylate/hydroxypyruvate reductase